MRFLLDSQALLWWLEAGPRLRDEARSAIENVENDVAFSVASIWELTIKESSGKLTLERDVREAMLAQGFGELPVLGEHALAVRDLPWHHRDPFDRMLVAQARIDGRTLITADRRLAAYDVGVMDARSR